MEVTFRRTGDRQYSVTVVRPGQPTLEMNPAPGFDPQLPHDLMHFVVERELGLRHGIFGQLANGGTAGTFRLLLTDEPRGRSTSRQQKALHRRGKKLLREGRREALLSERATYVCYQAWLTRSRGVQSSVSVTHPDATSLNRVCDVLDELSAEWSALGIGQELTVQWSQNKHPVELTNRTRNVSKLKIKKLGLHP